MSTRAATLLVTFAIILFSKIAGAQDQSTADPHVSSNVILLIEQTKGSVSGFEELERALAAHLGASSIEVRAHKVRSLPTKQSTMENKARSWANDEKASAVMWVDIEHGTMFLIFKDTKGDEQALSRYFDCISRALAECADPIASAVSSALSSWIGRSPQSQPQLTTEGFRSVTDNELDPVAIEKASWEERFSLLGLSFDVGYALSFLGDGPIAHGAHLGVRTIWVKYLSFDVSLQLSLRVDDWDSESGYEIQTTRWPLRMLVGGRYPWNDWSFGFSVGLVLSMNLRTTVDSADIVAEEKVKPGFASALIVDYEAFEWLSFWFKGGADIFNSGFEYVLEDSVGTRIEASVLEGAHWNLGLGLAFKMNIEGTRKH